MIRCLLSAVFVASSTLVLFSDAAPMNQLLSVACERNPSLEMCGGQAAVRARDAPEDEDTRSMRSFPKVTYDELQLDRYCSRHLDHYWHYCAGSGSYERPLRAKLVKFCPSFEKFCPEVSGKASKGAGGNFREAAVPLVIPPPLPSKRLNPTMTSPMAFDLPLPSSKDDESMPVQQQTSSGLIPLTPELIRTCTADCTAPHCTTECKCANTHPTVHAMCNPPANSELATTCQHWYSKCPMFKPVQY